MTFGSYNGEGDPLVFPPAKINLYSEMYTSENLIKTTNIVCGWHKVFFLSFFKWC